MHMRLPKSDFLKVTDSAILQYGGYDEGCLVKPLICYKYVILELLKFRNEWHHWKDPKKMAKKVIWFPMFGYTVFEILEFENLEKVLTQHFSGIFLIFKP